MDDVTGIDKIVEILTKNPRVAVDTVLVPEQCALIYIDDVGYHITVERMET